jgi:hypothetical protein
VDRCQVRVHLQAIDDGWVKVVDMLWLLMRQVLVCGILAASLHGRMVIPVLVLQRRSIYYVREKSWCEER